MIHAWVDNNSLDHEHGKPSIYSNGSRFCSRYLFMVAYDVLVLDGLFFMFVYSTLPLTRCPRIRCLLYYGVK